MITQDDIDAMGDDAVELLSCSLCGGDLVTAAIEFSRDKSNVSHWVYCRFNDCSIHTGVYACQLAIVQQNTDEL